jgi:alkylation response protein AidB-like acyl-CoA dehydrogenase
MYREMVSRVFDQEVAPHYERWEREARTPRELWNRMGEAGLLCTDLPETYGAAATSVLVPQLIIEEMGRRGYGGLSAGYNIHANIVAPYIFNIATGEQKARWLPGMVTGEILGAIAMTEPGAGSDLAGIRTSAVRDGEDWIINGSKVFITNGILADLVIVCAKTDTSAGARGISLFLVDTRLPGFSTGKHIEKIGQHSSDTAELFFQDLRVPADALLGQAGMGFVYLMQELPRERLGCAIQAIASAEACIDLTVEYVLERKAFGQAIARFQNTRFKLAELKTEVEMNRALFEKFNRKFLEGTMTVEEAAMIKLSSTETQVRVAHECLQLFGGYGYTLEYPISRFYCDARVQTIYAGSSEIMKEVIARGLLGR